VLNFCSGAAEAALTESLSFRSASSSPSYRSWAKVVCHSSLRAVVALRTSPRCWEELNVNASLDSSFRSQFALMHMAFLQLRVEEASCPFVKRLQHSSCCWARIGDSLELPKACTPSGMGLSSVQASFPLDSAN
jgi:hypothetical protein